MLGSRDSCPGLVHDVMAGGIEGQKLFRDNKEREGFLIRLPQSAFQ